MEKIEKTLVKVWYYGYANPPFRPDAYGYVCEEDLIARPSEWYYKWDENDEVLPREGYVFVYDENGNNLDGCECFAVVKADKILTEVFADDRLSGGRGTKYPLGGIESWSAPDYSGTYDGEEVLLVRYSW